jgi:hypothetical protein
MQRRYVLAAVVIVLLLGACAAGANPEVGLVDTDGDIAGFWSGLWHGFIAPITFLISLFTDTVNVYDVHNNGNWYDFGFVVGAGIILSGPRYRGGKRRAAKRQASS